jgi:hypothetical protein
VGYRASALGMCDKALVLARLGYEPSPVNKKLQAVYESGHKAEEWFRTTGNAKGVNFAQDSIRLDVPDTNASIVGHIDGLRQPTAGLRLVVEIKSQSTHLFAAWTDDAWHHDPLWKKYAWQVSAYLWGVGNGHGGPAELQLVRIRRPEHPDDDYQIHTSNYFKPFHSLNDLYERVWRIEQQTDLPTCDTPQFGCPYWTFHEEAEVVEDDDLDRACAHLKMAEKCAEMAEMEVKDAKEAVKTVLADRYESVEGKTAVSTLGGFSVKLTTFEKKAYDVKARHVDARTETRLTVTKGEG